MNNDQMQERSFHWKQREEEIIDIFNQKQEFVKRLKNEQKQELSSWENFLGIFIFVISSLLLIGPFSLIFNLFSAQGMFSIIALLMVVALLKSKR